MNPSSNPTTRSRSSSDRSYRNRPTRDFTVIRNAALRDPNLSLKAKGTLAMMLSFPDDWEYHQSHLESLSRDGRDALRTAIRELEAAGYITRHQTRREDGTLAEAEYHVTDRRSSQEAQPQDDSAAMTESTLTVDGLSVDGLPVDGLSDDGKPATTNTYSTKTDHTKTDRTNTRRRNEIEPTRNLTVSPDGDERVTPQDLVNTWNDHRGPLPAVEVLTQPRRRKLKRLITQHGTRSISILTAAAQQVSTDEFWIERGYGLDNLLAGEKYVAKAELWAQNGKIGGSRNRKHAARYAEIMTALGGES